MLEHTSLLVFLYSHLIESDLFFSLLFPLQRLHFEFIEKQFPSSLQLLHFSIVAVHAAIVIAALLAGIVAIADFIALTLAPIASDMVPNLAWTTGFGSVYVNKLVTFVTRNLRQLFFEVFKHLVVAVFALVVVAFFVASIVAIGDIDNQATAFVAVYRAA